MYILANSAHPQGCYKGLVQGMIYRYFRLNSEHDNFIMMTCKLYTRLVNRGYHKKSTKELILDTVSNLLSHGKPSTNQNSNQTFHPPLIFKTTYIRGTIRSYLRQIIFDTLETSMNNNNLPLEKLIIAFKRQKNIKELLFLAKLYLPQDINISKIRRTPIQYFLCKGYTENNALSTPDVH